MQTQCNGFFLETALMRRPFYIVPLLLVLSACSHRVDTSVSPEFLSPNGPSANPFSPAVRVGNLLFLAGQIGTNASGQLVSGGLQAEVRQTLNNISEVLQKTGSSLDKVVKCTVFMADMKEWAAMNEIYATYFRNHKPARSSFGTTGLAMNARVEIECIAVVN
ncbi:MAG TPA: RidA family protein [Gemmatimonadaceae bacterium]|nr:RidA family protein [Gemmatimonadaceae bacterium]